MKAESHGPEPVFRTARRARRVQLIIFALALPVFALHPRPASAQEPDGTPAPVLRARWGGVVIRPGHVALRKRFPYDVVKLSDITYPIVSRAPTTAVRERLRRALSLDSVYGFSLERYRREFGEDEYPSVEISYDITFQRAGLATVFFDHTIQGGGAARLSWRVVVVDLRTGRRLRAADVFDRAALGELARQVDQRMQVEIAHIGEDVHEARPGRYRDASGRPKHFGLNDLDRFSVGEDGVTFDYEFEPQVLFAEANDAHGDYFFPWAELRPMLRPDGPLAILAR